jgi:hypothetical protein
MSIQRSRKYVVSILAYDVSVFAILSAEFTWRNTEMFAKRLRKILRTSEIRGRVGARAGPRLLLYPGL